MTADGGACCDRIRFSVSVGSDAPDRRRVRRRWLRVRDRRRERGRDARARVRRCSTPRGSGRARSRPSSEASAPASCTRPSSLRTRSRAPSAPPLASAARSPVRRRAATLVAMSGGVDSAVAALLVRAVGGETVAVTLELWADSENDAERSCCSASAVAQARALAHSMGLPHFTIDLRDEFRDGVVEPFIAGFAGGETPNPCVGCNGHVRLDAMLELADRLGCRRLATGHYARIADGGRSRRAAAARRRRSRQGPDLHARRAVAELAAPDALPARGADQAGGPGDRRRRRAAGRRARPTRRTSASWPGPIARGSSPVTADCGDRAGSDRRSVRDRARPPPRPSPLHGRAAARARGRRRRAAVRARQGRRVATA